MNWDYYIFCLTIRAATKAAILNDYSTIKSMDDLQDQTMVIEIEGSKRLIIQQF